LSSLSKLHVNGIFSICIVIKNSIKRSFEIIINFFRHELFCRKASCLSLKHLSAFGRWLDSKTGPRKRRDVAHSGSNTKESKSKAGEQPVT
jgi:hypothetical protein